MAEFMGVPYSVPYTIIAERLESVQDGVNLRRHILQSDAVRFRFDCTFVGNASDLAKIVAHRDAMGTSGTFNANLPQRPGITVPSAASLTANAARGATSITATRLPAGIMFMLGGKLYQITNDRGGIMPALRASATSGTQLGFTLNPVVRYAPGSVFGTTYVDNLVQRVSVSFEEVL